MMFMMNESVFAKTCEYEYVYVLYADGRTDVATAYKGDTIQFDISDSGVISGYTLENWSSSSCPRYVVEISTGWLPWAITRKYYGYASGISWTGPETETMRGSGGTMIVYQNKEEEETPEFTCQYGDFDLLINPDSHSISASSTKDGGTIYYLYTIAGEVNGSWLDEENGDLGKCLSVKVCTDDTDPTPGGTYIFKTIYMDALQVPAGQYNENACQTFDYIGDEETRTPSETDNNKCRTLGNYIRDIKKFYSQAQKNGLRNSGSILKQADDEITKLKALCNSAYRTFDYSEECVQECIDVDKKLANLKDEYGISGPISYTNSCNISERLAAWLIRTISWIRYIAPVIIIILTILDFIKAIAADNEDEIKKVSGKFIKRLIVALILFLLPLLIEFLLGIFNQDTYQYCLK